MADTRISDLTAGAAVAGTDLLANVQAAGAGPVKTTAAQLKTFMSASPTLVTPVLGVASATSINKLAITAPATSATLAIADGKTLTISNTLTFQATDGTTINFGAGGTFAYTSANLSVFAATTSAQFAGVISDETGTGLVVLNNGPTFIAPLLGTPASGVLTNATGLPISTGVSGLGAGIATFLATPSSANLATAMTDETGSGALVFATSPTLVTPALGTPASGVLTNATGLPLATGVTGNLPVTNLNSGTNADNTHFWRGDGTWAVPAGGGSGTPGGSDTQLQYNNAGAFGGISGVTTNGTAITSTAVLTVSGASLVISGNQSAAAWTTAGLRLKGTAATLTDTSSSGTVAAAYTNVLGGNTIAASSATTFTNYFEGYLKDPIAGANVTLTNKWALGADSLLVGTSGTFKVSTAGVLTTTGAQLTTPTLGVAAGTSLALGGATIGADALGVTGTTTLSSKLTITQANANTGVVASTGYSLTGSDATNMIDLAGTWNTSGAPTALKIAISNTASGAAAFLLNLLSGASGTTSQFSVDAAGTVVAAGPITAGTNIVAGANSRFGFTGRSRMVSPADGSVLIENNATTNGFTLSFPTALATPTFQLGALDAAAPVAQIIRTQGSRGGTDSNVGGAQLTVETGLGTGTGAIAKMLFRVPILAASGTTAQTYGTAITINDSSATGLQFNGYGAGALSTDASGNITATSDMRMKYEQRKFTDGLDALRRISPIVYKWRPESGMETKHEYAGFSAQNVRDEIELATGQNPDGTLTLQDRALLAACVNAINELAQRL